MLCSLSVLRENDMAAIRSLESKLGKPLLAYTCHWDVGAASLDEEELGQIRDLEEKLGLSLVAVKG